MSDMEAPYEPNDTVISIGVLSERVGLSVSAVRTYENEGLVIGYRTPSRHRLCPPRTAVASTPPPDPGAGLNEEIRHSSQSPDEVITEIKHRI